MPPKIPPSLEAAIAPALALLCFLPSLAIAQLGYEELLSEQGGNLSPSAGPRLVYIPEESDGWSYWTGDLGDPGSDWRLSSFTEPSGWLTGQTSVGYGDSDDNTVLGGMRNRFTTVYLRHQFTIPPGGVPSILHLRLYVDDGAIVWLNGNEIARSNVTPSAPGPGSLATSTIGNASWQDFIIPGAGGIANEGTNTVAIHALNATSNSSDFSIDIELGRPRIDYGHVEGVDGSDNFLPLDSPNTSPTIGYQFEGIGSLANKFFEIRSTASGLSYARSGHAANVASFSYRSENEDAGFFLTNFRCWEAGNFLGSGLLKSGGTPPDPSLTLVQNHSWITTEESHSEAQLNNYLRRFDYMAARDKVLCAVGLNNGDSTTVPQVWGCSYNSIVVGRTDGKHSRGGTVSGVDGAGRIKPDVVSPGSGSATSYSTANVSGAAALLLGHAYDRPELGQVFNPEVSKAILMAGATKPSGWSHSSSQPLDVIFGAGIVNIYDSFHLLSAGQQAHGGGAPVGTSGWDYASITPAATASYTFSIREDKLATSCSIILTWFRQFAGDPASNDFATQPTLADFELRLYESEDGIPGTQIGLSDSAVDNVEHVYLEGLPAGEYTFTVNTDSPSPFAIAWQSHLSDLPLVAFAGIDPGGAGIDLDLRSLIIGYTYTLQYSSDLIGWGDLHTVTASADTQTFTHVAIPSAPQRGFYRIAWSP